MANSSRYGIQIDFEKSQSSYIYDQSQDRKFLDFFGQYSSLSLGYNHPIFKSESFLYDIKRLSSVKITNCEIISKEAQFFDSEFKRFALEDTFSHTHYCCTGALAIESALKTAIDYKKTEHPRFITFKGSFHGINSYGPLITDRFGGVLDRLKGFPESDFPPLKNPIIEYKEGEAWVNEPLVRDVLDALESIAKTDPNVAGILVEPVQCTYGDHYFPDSFFKGVRDIADTYNIPLIFDEIQTGFGGSGTLWYFEQLPIAPDILVFGKKTFVSGIAVKQPFSKIFQTPSRLEVTWDADVIDMVRCTYLIKAFEELSLLDHVKKMGHLLHTELKKTSYFTTVRSAGLLIACDFETQEMRDLFVNQLFEKGMICNPTGEHTVRFRPPLTVSEKEVHHALDIISTLVISSSIFNQSVI